MLVILLLVACGDGSNGSDAELVPLTFDVLDGTMGIVNGSDGGGICDPAEACFEDGTDAFLVIDATTGAVTVTVPYMDEITTVLVSGTPYDIISGGEGDEVDPAVGYDDNSNYEWVDGQVFVQPELCNPEDGDCVQLDE